MYYHFHPIGTDKPAKTVWTPTDRVRSESTHFVTHLAVFQPKDLVFKCRTNMVGKVRYPNISGKYGNYHIFFS